MSIFPDHDAFDRSDDYLDTANFATAQEQVAEYVEEVKVATVANIVRRFPEHERVMFSILHKLKQAGRIYWDEWRPLPTMIYAGDRRLTELPMEWRAAADRSWEIKEKV